jgi:hypothetical protein
LAEGLSPVELDSDALAAVKRSPYNLNRRQHLESRGPGVYFFADCDILSFLYLAVADELRLPLRIVERPNASDEDPGHNFVRWLLPGGKWVDWETITGTRWHEPSRDAYALSDGQMSGYVQALLGAIWSRAWNSQRSIAAYEAALAHGYESQEVLNNLVWDLSIDPNPVIRNMRAVAYYSAKLCSGELTPNYLDTCAAASARQGDFDHAVDLEMRAIALTTRVATREGMRARLALYKTKHPYTAARVREQKAIDACEAAGDLLKMSIRSHCPDPSGNHF